MRTLLAATWPLLLGVAFMMAGNGLQQTLLGVRATLEGFPASLTGFITSGYFIGFYLGSWQVPRFVGRVGHVRVFAGLCALGSIAILVQAVFINWPAWMALRAVTGFSFAGIYIVCESWLNDRAQNENRGRLLSFYMVIQFAGVAVGQVLFLSASPAGDNLFILVSILLSVSVLPVVLAPGPAPRFDMPAHISLLQLYRVSPLGIIGLMGVGLSVSGFLGMGPVFAKIAGLSDAGIALFMIMATASGAVLQWPIGRLSDSIGRRPVLIGATLGATIVAAAAMPFAGGSNAALFILTFLFGSLSLPLYSLCVTHTNDFLKPEQMVAASSGLILAYGIGAIFGPTSAGWLIDRVGPAGYFLYCAIIHAAMTVFALYRASRRPAPPPRSQAVEERS